MEDTVELRAFVTAALEQIVTGAADAQKAVASLGAEVNPTITGGPEVAAQVGFLRSMDSTGQHKMVVAVEFDVAVTAQKKQGKEAGVGVMIAAALGIGGKVKKEQSTNVVSRMQFKVPIRLPSFEVSSAPARPSEPSR